MNRGGKKRWEEKSENVTMEGNGYNMKTFRSGKRYLDGKECQGNMIKNASIPIHSSLILTF